MEYACVCVLQFMNQRQFRIPEQYCDAVMHCKEGAAILFLQALYELLTSRQSVAVYVVVEKSY